MLRTTTSGFRRPHSESNVRPLATVLTISNPGSSGRERNAPRARRSPGPVVPFPAQHAVPIRHALSERGFPRALSAISFV